MKGREVSLKMRSKKWGTMEAGRESRIKKEIVGTGAVCEEWLYGAHRKTGHLATEILVFVKLPCLWSLFWEPCQLRHLAQHLFYIISEARISCFAWDTPDMHMTLEMHMTMMVECKESPVVFEMQFLPT